MRSEVMRFWLDSCWRRGVTGRRPQVRSVAGADRRHHPEVRGQGSRVRQGARESTPIARPRASRNWTTAGPSTGRWETVSDIVFSAEGKRTETRGPRRRFPPCTTSLLTPEDLEDMRSVQPFVLTTPDLPKYLIRYLGQQNVDEIGCYVVRREARRRWKAGQRYFAGDVWVDDRDLQIVKSYGRGVGSHHARAITSSPSSRPTASRSTANTGSPPIPSPTTRCTSKSSTSASARPSATRTTSSSRRRTTITFGDAVDDKKDDTKGGAPPKKP